MDTWEIVKVTLLSEKGFASVKLRKGNRKATLAFDYRSGRMKITETNARGLDSPRVSGEELKALKPKILTAIAVKRMVL